ncbi:MAG: terpene cyclase/mutase family protein [Phycisphaeraceae bacterium]|nr:terpene cyclase/mutase family protein [Phycisphaerales bacterium]QOJ16865.1 MAG: terpene cyclase/mutase family protein [Phycisphaeraceae bacterium]
MHHTLIQLIAAAALGMASPLVAVQDPPPGGGAGSGGSGGAPPAGAQNDPLAGEMTDASDKAVERGFQFLLSQQMSDGSFGRGRLESNVGVTALACLALMSDGHLPGRGEYGEAVQKGLRFILDRVTETGFIVGETTSHGPMYEHGFAALFLGEIYGMNPSDERVREALVKATHLIINSQNDEGGWRYYPVPFDADISVTICEVMALRSARNAGIKVPKETIDRAVEYVRNCQNHDGGFRYMLGTGGSAWPRTAAGVASLFYAGIHEDNAIDRGLDYIARNAMPGAANRTGEAHYFYGHYYAVQAMYLAGGKHWERWWPAIRDELVRSQSSNGSWPDHYANGAYGTAMALIILQMPKRYLPIFQK